MSGKSTGGTDDVEPKLSLIPLIIGSLKGTVYAMLFAVPIALLAAIYVTILKQPDGVAWSSRPWKSRRHSFSDSGISGCPMVGTVARNAGPLVLTHTVVSTSHRLTVWQCLEYAAEWYRTWIKPGSEFLAFVPILVLVAYLAWCLGPVFDRLVFGDFRQWWPRVTGASFEQRNSLVVGFMMGFAVIPIVFTITEDALSSVPPELKSGSLALGASRWQTAIRVVLPTASAGFFGAHDRPGARGGGNDDCADGHG